MHIQDLASLTPDQLHSALEELGDEEALELLYTWEFHARPDQMHPSLDEDWDNWLILAGRGWGKTRTGAETIDSWANKEVAGRIAIIAEDAGDARDVMVEGESGIIACSHPRNRPKYEPSKRRLTWPNGALASIFSADDPESLRGPQFDAAWVDELAKFKYAQETWDMLSFGLRLGVHPRTIITTTPRPIPLIKRLAEDSSTIVTSGSTYDNIKNLSKTFQRQVLSRYEGTRLGKQEIEAAILGDFIGALWSQEDLEKCRADQPVPHLIRVVVAVDPSGRSDNPEETGGDTIGIVTAGIDAAGDVHVLEDASCKKGPMGWSKVVAGQYRKHEADKVVGEVNFGGGMVEAVIRSAYPNISYSSVRASRGKSVRAEPVSALYQRGKVKHHGNLAELEDQLASFTLYGYKGEGSPDRADALVWAVTELALDENGYTLDNVG